MLNDPIYFQSLRTRSYTSYLHMTLGQMELVLTFEALIFLKALVDWRVFETVSTSLKSKTMLLISHLY